MDTALYFGAACIAPAFLLWSLIRSARLNRTPLRVGRLAEGQAWAAFAVAVAASVGWWLDGRQAQTIALGQAQWFGIRIDALTVPLILLVSFLAAIILRFSRNYLAGDPEQGRFVKWMCVTLGSVAALITAPGLVQFWLAWVATSLSLHQLLVFFPDRHGTQFSARKKFLVSRIADLGLAVAFLGVYAAADAQSFSSLLAGASDGSFDLPAYAPWLIAACAILKSAQFPFHTWLPDTMGAPTPVSALMHAGIINAGGFLIIRFAAFFQASAAPLYALALFGGLTAAFASLVMLSQTSIKRSLAYSTIAQMGFMLMQCGLGAFHLALLHIVAHSLYKAHTFLSSGSAVHAIQSRETRSPANESPLQALAPVAAGFALSLAPLFLLGYGLNGKPGTLVFAGVLAAALAQFLTQFAARHLLVRTGMAAAISGAYFILASVSAWWLQPVTALTAVSHPLFDGLLAIALIAVLLLSIQLQKVAESDAPAPWLQRLYVHALNGFYCNTLANRTLRFLRLHPNHA